MLVPSPVVVSDADSLAANFGQNATRFLCDLSFGTGAYAIGGRLLGAAKFTPATALITTSALMAALLLCPSGANQEAIFGTPPPFTGGQCNVGYRLRVTGFAQGSPIDSRSFVIGPVRLIETPLGGGVINWNVIGSTTAGGFSINYRPSGGDSLNLAVVRDDGQADNCGDPPGGVGQVITNNDNSSDIIDSNNVVDNSSSTTVIPVSFNLGGIQNTLNLEFGDIRIGSILPFTFTVNIGGADFSFERNPDGTTKPVPTSPDPEVTPDGLKKILEQIKDCVCKKPVDLDMLFLPYVKADETCDVQTETFLVPKGSVSQTIVNKFIDSATAASDFCSNSAIAQKPEVLIFAASTTQDGREIFSGDIGVEVKSLRFKITANRNENLRPITNYPAANQFKFGSISFVTKTVSGGGDYLYVFDTDTYYPLPKRGKEGRLRILLKAGLSFEVYDTGERY